MSAPVRNEIADAIAEAEHLATRGDWLGAIDRLTATNRVTPHADIEASIVDLRHRAWPSLRTSELTAQPRGGTCPPIGPSGLPEIDASALTAETARAAIVAQGSLLVHGLLSEADTAALRATVDTAMAAFRSPSPYWHPLTIDPGVEAVMREPMIELVPKFVLDAGGALLAYSPRAMFQVLELLEDRGLHDLATTYLGGRPAMSANKCTLRRVEPDLVGNWHQDGAFLGGDIPAFNLWLGLSDCGVDAPGLEVVPRRFDRVIETGTGGAIFDWSVGPDVVAEEAADVPVLAPEFREGDALLFDHLFHRTSGAPHMREIRYALEFWCFAPSAYPAPDPDGVVRRAVSGDAPVGSSSSTSRRRPGRRCATASGRPSPMRPSHPNATDGTDRRLSVISLSHLLDRWAARRDEIRAVAGHFLSTVELLDADFVTVSVLRPPVERTLSYLRHQQKINRADRDTPLEEIYDDPFRFAGLIRNHMTRMFAIGADEMGPGDGVLTDVADTPDLLERAKAGVASLDAFGLQPHFEEFWAELAGTYGLDPTASVTSNTTPPQAAPAALVARIEADNQLDLELYAYAEELYAHRHPLIRGLDRSGSVPYRLPMDLVPTVDLRHPTAVALDELAAACADHGFFLLRGHGLDDVIDRTWHAAREFFATGRDNKSAIGRGPEQMLGWYDRELTKRRRDHKEVFDFIDPALPATVNPNRWPVAPSGFRETMTEFFDSFAALATTTLDLVHHSLGLDTAAAAAHTNPRSTGTVRLNHYPVGDPVPVAERGDLNPLGDVALGHHTDPGVLTLLLQDDTGGLQAESRDHGWIDIEPRPGTVVVNLGDTLQVWTNDRYRAAVHRVTPMTDRSRYSIPYFSNPPRDCVIEPIGALTGGTPRYRPFTWREFIHGRASDNFADYGADDIQISDFAVDTATTSSVEGRR
ncbi:MAG: 2OG-Fe(II) oxygenase family protein [Acidimicrobiales bacterium]